MKSEKVKQSKAKRKKTIDRIAHKWAMEIATNPEMGIEWAVKKAMEQYEKKFKKELNEIADNQK